MFAHENILLSHIPTHQLFSSSDTSIPCLHLIKCAHTCLVRIVLTCTIFLEQSHLQSEIIKHTYLFPIVIEISPLQASLLTGCV